MQAFSKTTEDLYLFSFKSKYIFLHLKKKIFLRKLFQSLWW